MRALVGAHVLLWAVDQPSQLGAAAISALHNPSNDLLLSAGTAWELAIKVGLKKLTLSLPYGQWMTQAIKDLQLSALPITVKHAETQAALALHHRDPFDRLLVAQAIVENVCIVTADPQFDAYGIKRVWG